ncbi:hypothetical protein ACLK19_03025 [Escherichia coli]
MWKRFLDNVIADLDIHPVKRIEEVLTLALQNEPSGMQVVTANSDLAQNALIKTGLAGLIGACQPFFVSLS